MSKIRVLHAITNMHIGGAENLVRKILLSLDPNKFEPYLLLMENDGQFLEEIATNERIHIIKLETRFKRFNPLLLLEIIRLLKKYKISIVHSHLFKSNLYVRIAAVICGCRKVIFHEHGGILEKQFRHRISEAFLQFFTDNFIYISKHDLNYFVRHSWLFGNNRMVVLPNPCLIDGPRPTPKIPAQVKTVGMVGKLHQMKGQIFCLQALVMLQEEGLILEVYLLGDGPDRERLEKFCHDHGIKAYFIGNVLDVYSYYDKCDVFIHPSLSEGFGMVIVEAMSFGLPVIATNVGGIPEIIEDGINGLLVEPSSAESIKDALAVLLSNIELRRRLSENALITYSEKYTFNKYIHSLEAIYLEEKQS